MKNIYNWIKSFFTKVPLGHHTVYDIKLNKLYQIMSLSEYLNDYIEERLGENGKHVVGIDVVEVFLKDVERKKGEEAKYVLESVLFNSHGTITFVNLFHTPSNTLIILSSKAFFALFNDEVKVYHYDIK